MDAFLRLLRYARTHTGLIAGAVLAMVVYGAASAAIAWLIKPIVDDVLPSQDRARVRHHDLADRLRPQGARAPTSPAF